MSNDTIDNWQQYATEREATAQQVIERHRREHESLLRLLAKDRGELERLRAQVAPAGWWIVHGSDLSTRRWPVSEEQLLQIGIAAPAQQADQDWRAASDAAQVLAAERRGNVAQTDWPAWADKVLPLLDKLTFMQISPSLTVGEREAFEAWARGFSTLSLERDSHGHYVCMEQELLWLGFQAGKGKAPAGASLGESNADAGLGLAGPNSACSHEFVLQPSSSIHLCAKCGISEVAAAPAAQAEPVALIVQALELASVIADRVPNRVHLDQTAPEALRDIGKLINAQDNGLHGYRLINDALRAAKGFAPASNPPAQGATAELAAAREDAERYRWLIEGAYPTKDDDSKRMEYRIHVPTDVNWVAHSLHGKPMPDIDAAIDAARKADKPGSEGAV